jgi:hypothetical protein
MYWHQYTAELSKNKRKNKRLKRIIMCSEFLNLTFRGPRIVIYSYNERQQGALILKLFDKVLYMFRTDPLSIIRSISKLYTHNRYLSCQFCGWVGR